MNTPWHEKKRQLLFILSRDHEKDVRDARNKEGKSTEAAEYEILGMVLSQKPWLYAETVEKIVNGDLECVWKHFT